LKFAGALAAGLFVRTENKTMTNGKLLARALRGETLLESEIMQLERAMNEQETYSRILQASTEVGSPSLKVRQTYSEIYSRVVSVATASLEIRILGTYRHLVIMGAGRTTGAGTSVEHLFAQFNNDSGANYINQKTIFGGTSLSTSRDTGQTQGIVGILQQGGGAAGYVCSFRTDIPHYNNIELTKNALGYFIAPTGNQFIYTSNWLATDAIQTITLTPGADSIAPGAVISVYGIE
jgi:hypothetical protein